MLFHGFLRVVVPLMMGRAVAAGKIGCGVRGVAIPFAGEGIVAG